jgi:hypothetical protein
VRSPEGTDAQVEEDHDNSSAQQKFRVIGAMGIAHSDAPKSRAKDKHGQKKEYARDFKPDHMANAAKWAQKATHAARYATSGLAGSLACRVVPSGRDCSRPRSAGCALRCHVLAGNSCGHAHADPKSPADKKRSHSVYDGSSGS